MLKRELEDRLERATQRIEELTEAVKQGDDTADAQTAMLDALRGQLASSQTARNQFKKNSEELNSRLKGALGRNSRLVTELGNARKEVSRLCADSKDKDSKINALTDGVNDLSNMAMKVAEEKNDLQKQVKQLKEQDELSHEELSTTYPNYIPTIMQAGMCFYAVLEEFWGTLDPEEVDDAFQQAKRMMERGGA